MSAEVDSGAVVSFAVMSVPERAELVAALMPKIDREGWIIEDVAHDGPWPTARTAWLSAHDDASHHLVLQDDVIVAPDLIAGLERMLDMCPTVARNPVSLFGISRELRKAGDAGATFLEGNGISWGQGLLLPTRLIPLFLYWCDVYVRPEYKHDDARLSLFALSQGFPVYTTIPCLVDHLQVPSVAGNPMLAGGRHERKAAIFDPEQSALEIPWTEYTYERKTHRLDSYVNWYAGRA